MNHLFFFQLSTLLTPPLAILLAAVGSGPRYPCKFSTNPTASLLSQTGLEHSRIGHSHTCALPSGSQDFICRFISFRFSDRNESQIQNIRVVPLPSWSGPSANVGPCPGIADDLLGPDVARDVLFCEVLRGENRWTVLGPGSWSCRACLDRCLPRGAIGWHTKCWCRIV